mmetsp:Transcript_6634/g.20058  ORF Transcript_6634/g.20058 Transcript_6634/m.20058 type:complete len:528 (+) Transcript_6634:76-1659(+)
MLLPEMSSLQGTHDHSHSQNLLGALLSLFLVFPATMLLEQLDELPHRVLLRDAAAHHLLAHVQVDLARQAAHVAKVCVRHLAGAVDDAAHHRDGHARQVARRLSDMLRHLLQVEQRAAAAGARHVLRLDAAHAAALQQPERRAHHVLGAEPLRLEHRAIAQAVAQQPTRERARPDEQVVGVHRAKREVVDHWQRHPVARDRLEDAAGGVHATDLRGALDGQEDAVAGLELLEAAQRGVVLRAAQLHHRAQRALRQRLARVLARERLLDGVQRNRGRHGARLEGRGRRDHAQACVLEALERAARLGVVLGGHLVQHDGVHGGHVLEGHAHRKLAAQLLVQRLGCLQLLQRHPRQHRAVAVQHRAQVYRVVLALANQLAAATLKFEEVARRLGEGDGRLPLVLGGLGTQACQRAAGHDLELGVLREAHADSVAQAVHEQRADADGRLHAAVLTIACLSHPQVHGVVPAKAVQLRRQQAVRLHHHQRVGRLHGKHKVVEVVLAADARELKGRLHHALGRVAVVRQRARRK